MKTYLGLRALALCLTYMMVDAQREGSYVTEVRRHIVEKRACPPPPAGEFGGAYVCLSLVTVTAQHTDDTGKAPVATVTWAASDVTITNTEDGKSKETVVTGWVCGGNLCNPNCKVPAQKCEGQDGPGVSGFPWPKVSL